jgi:glycosyltransferase involved in cell wall biosynthesis
LRAFARIRESRPETRLLLISHEPFTAYDSLARELGLQGAVEPLQVEPHEVPALLAAGDVAVSPRTDCPGVPQKLLNYMAAGRPIVAFEGSAGEIVDGETGLRVENGDVEALAGAIARLLDEPALAARLGRGAHEQVAARRTWAVRAEELERVYAKVVADAAARAGIGRPTTPDGASRLSHRSTVAGTSHTS